MTLKGSKLKKGAFPTGHSRDDFKCFGPPATQDGEFSNTMLCDMGCFKQDEVDSNKYYHGAVVQSTKTGDWYAYFEYGRVGQPSPSCQFILGPDKATAQAEYEKQMHAKNDKRGQWINKPGLGKILQPKPGKDCYLVRPQATRSTGLSDARTIVHGITKKTAKTITKNSQLDSRTSQLLDKLKVGTATYTRSAMTTAAIPTQDAIDKARLILGEATTINNKLTCDAARLSNKDLEDLTRMIYSLLPKKKGRKADKDDWWLIPTNIMEWQQDIDAFESALQAQDCSLVQTDLPFGLSFLDKNSDLGHFVYNWIVKATRNRHYHISNAMNVKGIWKVNRTNDFGRFITHANGLGKRLTSEKPLHQSKRPDLSSIESDLFHKTNTHMLLHGTRTVNVSGILNTGLRLPKQLSNVSITGAMFGSGTYFADDWKKSAGYCSYRGSYWSRGGGSITGLGAFMFICDVTLGKPFVAPGPRGYNGPPKGYDSIFGKMGNSGVANNEYVIFNLAQHNLRYLVEFAQ